jgi:hypothetical protein
MTVSFFSTATHAIQERIFIWRKSSTLIGIGPYVPERVIFCEFFHCT